MTTCDNTISHVDWLSIQVKPNEIFQLKNGLTECRMVKVFQNNKYTETKRAGADMARLNPALVKLTIDKVLAIAGTDHDSCDALFSVSSYDIKRDTWQIDLPKLNTARDAASACVLKANVYVF